MEKYPELLPFCDYLLNGTNESDDAFVHAIDEKVTFFNNDEDWKKEYMEWEMEKKIIADDALKRGLMLGHTKGKKEGLLILYKVLNETFPAEEAFRKTCANYPDIAHELIREWITDESSQFGD